MKKFIVGFAITAIVLSGTAASALPIKKKKSEVIQPSVIVSAVEAPKLASWTGGYIGAFGAYTTNSTVTIGYSGVNYPDSNLTGLGGGVQAGYDYQMETSVVGAAVEFNASGANDSWSGTISGTSVSDSYTMPTTWVARGRLGLLASDKTLIYATAGYAYGQRKASITIGGTNYNDTENQSGYLVGGGLEYRITPQLSAFAEYRYYGFNAANYTLGAATFSIKDSENEVRLGVNYRF